MFKIMDFMMFGMRLLLFVVLVVESVAILLLSPNEWFLGGGIVGFGLVCWVVRVTSV